MGALVKNALAARGIIRTGMGIKRGLLEVAPGIPDVNITATVAPATSALVVGQALQDTTNWLTFLDAANYATSAAGATISTVVVNYVGDTATAAEAFIDGEANHFSVTVTDSLGNSQTFQTTARTVVYAAPVVTGTISNQVWTQDVAIASVDVGAYVTGENLTFEFAPTSGSLATGLGMSALGVISGTPTVTTSNRTLIIRVSNSGDYVDLEFDAIVEASSSNPAPVITDAAFDDSTDTYSFTSDQAGTAYLLLDAGATPTKAQMELGQGDDGLAADAVATPFAVSVGANSGSLDVSGVADGANNIYAMVKNATGERSTVAVTPVTISNVAFVELHPDPNFQGLTSYLASDWVIGSGVADLSGVNADNEQIEILGSSNRITVDPSTNYRLQVNVSDVGVPATANRLELIMLWYTSAGAFISTDTAPIADVAGTGLVSFTATSPATAGKFNHRVRNKDANSDMTLNSISFGAV